MKLGSSKVGHRHQQIAPVKPMRDVRRLLRVAGVLTAVVSLCAAPDITPQSDSEFAALLAEAQKTFTDHDWDRGALAYEALLAAARAKNAELWEARALLGFGKMANERAQFAEARVRALEALEIFERLNAAADSGEANRTLGIATESGGDDAGAKRYYERAVEHYRAAGDRAARVEASYRMLSVGADRPDDEYGVLQTEAHELGDKGLEGDILHTWGDLLFQQALYEPAIEKLEAAAALFQEEKRTDDLGTTYNSLGRVYREHGQPAAALQFQLKALAIHETLNTPRLLIQSLNAVAVASEVLGEKDQARAYYERALAVAQQTGAPAYITFMRANLGGFLIESGEDVEPGRALVERALADGAGFRSLRYTQLAMAFQQLGRYQDALAAAERALTECRAPIECLYARFEEGRTQLALGNDGSALAAHKEVLAIIEKMHATLASSDLLKQDFQRLWAKAYSLTIDLHFKRGEYREALEAAELARSRAFLDLLASRELKRPARAASVTPTPVAPAVADATSPSPVALTLRGTAAGAGSQAQAQAIATSLRSEAAAPPPTLDGLTAIAARLNSTLLAYWVGDTKVYAWALTPDGTVHGASVSIARAKLDELIRSSAAFGRASEEPSAARPTMATRGDSQIAVSARNPRTWRALYDLLIAPIERDLPRTPGARLTIVPYGPLLDVPFAALRDARGRYLIERYTIHSVPAAAVLQFTAAKVRADARGGSVLLVGDPAGPPTIPGDPPLPRLAGASEEVRAIARLLPPRARRCWPAAPPPNRASVPRLPGTSIIHFATHGIVRDANPLASFLALGTVGDGVADGQLTADKIYGLDLDAEPDCVERVPIGRRRDHRRWYRGAGAGVLLRGHAVGDREHLGRGGPADQSAAAGVLSRVAERGGQGQRVAHGAARADPQPARRSSEGDAARRAPSSCRKTRPSGRRSSYSASRTDFLPCAFLPFAFRSCSQRAVCAQRKPTVGWRVSGSVKLRK